MPIATMHRLWHSVYAGHERLFALLAFALAYVAFFSPVLFGHRLLAQGNGFQYYLPHYYASRTLWEPRLMTGYPVYADPQVMTWYPIAMFMRILPDSWNYFVLWAFIFASWFTYLYVYELILQQFPAILSGLVYGFSGFMISHIGHTSMIHTAAWLPGLFVIAEKLRNGRTLLWSMLGSLIVACFILAGHSQIVVYGLSLTTAYVLTRQPGPHIDRWKYQLAGLGFLALGVAIASIQLVPLIELTGLSVRAQWSYTRFVENSLAPAQLVSLIFPYLFGGSPESIYIGRDFAPWGRSEVQGFVGYGAIVLVVSALVARPRDLPVRFWWVTAVLSVLLSLGAATPLSTLLYRVPVFGHFRAQARFMLLFTLAAATLAGVGAYVIVTREDHRREFIAFPVWSLVMLLFGVSVLSIAAGPRLKEAAAAKGVMELPMAPWRNPAIGAPVASALGFTAALILLGRKPHLWLTRLAVAVSICLELFAFGWFWRWRYESPPQSFMKLPAVLQRYRKALWQDNQRWMCVYGGDDRFWEIPPDVSRLWDVPSISKYGPLLPERYHELMQMEVDGTFIGDWWEPSNRSVDLTGAQYIALPANRSDLLGDRTHWKLVDEIAGSRIYRNLRAMPRSWLAWEVRQLTAAEVLRTIHTSRLPDGSVFNPAQTALVEEPLALPPHNRDPEATVRLVRTDNTRVELHVKTSRPACLVLADLYYPGWTVYVNAQPAHMIRTNYVQRGVLVPAGHSVVVFLFRPVMLCLGATLSVITLVIVIICIFFTRCSKAKSDTL
jgi:hypothetical protein